MVCSKEYYTPPKTPKIKNNVGLDIGNMKAKGTKNILETTKIIVERMKMETRKLSRKTTSEKWDNINS
jgi:hypothetical protein